MWGMIIMLVILAVLVFGFIGIYNNLVRMRNAVRNAWKQIDVQLKRRHDLIPNLVEVVKDYMEYEQETLEKVIQARNQAISAQGVRDTSAAEAELEGALGRLLAVVENYPDLKANQNVTQLQEELTSTENKIAFARQYYNDSVMRINNQIEMFPSNMVAGMFGFKPEEYFEIADSERENVKVDLR
jgi:LemA protein